MAVIKKCVVCGKLYQARANSKTCSPECKKINNRIVNNKAHMKNYYDYKRINELKGCKSELLDIEIEKARQMGITYGQYKARQFLFRQKAEEVANE